MILMILPPGHPSRGCRLAGHVLSKNSLYRSNLLLRCQGFSMPDKLPSCWPDQSATATLADGGRDQSATPKGFMSRCPERSACGPRSSGRRAARVVLWPSEPGTAGRIVRPRPTAELPHCHTDRSDNSTIRQFSACYLEISRRPGDPIHQWRGVEGPLAGVLGHGPPCIDMGD
jgi:hypothetical protein